VKLGIICEGTCNSFYRAIFPMRALHRRGHTVLFADGVVDLPMKSLLGCDLVHCYRRMDRIEDLRKLVRHGVAVSFDNDDNYAAAEVSHGGKGLAGRRFNQGLARMTVTAAKIAHVTTTTCAPLADYYRAAGVEHVETIPNRLEPSAFELVPGSRHEGVVVGWVADREHKLDLERLPIAAALRDLLESNEDVRVTSVGLRLPINSSRYEHIADVPFLDLLKAVGAFDIGIAPLVDTEFNRSRSDVKLKEYSTAGTPWLASPVGPYRELGEREGGALVADQDWAGKMLELVEGSRKRKRLARRALRWAKGQAVDRHIDRWEEVFLAAIQRATAGGPA
jgi:glycosyltransferase involved in cell wall biosynthesis